LNERNRSLKILDVLQFGFFLMLIGTIYIVTPNLPKEVSDFFRDFELNEAYPTVFLPAPKSNHPVLYNAASQFAFAFALFQTFVLLLEFLLMAPVNKKAETFSGIIFWFGLAASLNMLRDGGITWFIFLGFIIILAGATLVIRSLITLSAKITRQK